MLFPQRMNRISYILSQCLPCCEPGFQNGYQHDGPFLMALVYSGRPTGVYQGRPSIVPCYLHCPHRPFVFSLCKGNQSPVRISLAKRFTSY